MKSSAQLCGDKNNVNNAFRRKKKEIAMTQDTNAGRDT